MPLGDGTGPAGLGPMTGRAAGYCAGYPVPGFANPIIGQGGFGRGFGWSGGGRGRGFRNMYRATGIPAGTRYNMGYPGWGGIASYPYDQTIAPEKEAEALKNQVKLLQDNLNAINKRIQELEKTGIEKQEPKK
jgi:hypothetical protein